MLSSKLECSPLIAICTDIAFHNPRVYPICFTIISKFLMWVVNDDEKYQIITKIQKKFSRLANTGHLEIWLQRLSIQLEIPPIEFNEKLCHLVQDSQIEIWNSEWISSQKLKLMISESNIIDNTEIAKLPKQISLKEVELFKNDEYQNI